MKASINPAATRRLLADIADAIRPIEHARTAAAVDRVLATASRGLYDPMSGRVALWELYEEVDLATSSNDDGVCLVGECSWCDQPEPVDDLPGLTYYLDAQNIPCFDRERNTPWVVSPDLFTEVPS